MGFRGLLSSGGLFPQPDALGSQVGLFIALRDSRAQNTNPAGEQLPTEKLNCINWAWHWLSEGNTGSPARRSWISWPVPSQHWGWGGGKWRSSFIGELKPWGPVSPWFLSPQALKETWSLVRNRDVILFAVGLDSPHRGSFAPTIQIIAGPSLCPIFFSCKMKMIMPSL